MIEEKNPRDHNGAMPIHQAVTTTHERNKPYKCTQCDKSYP